MEPIVYDPPPADPARDKARCQAIQGILNSTATHATKIELIQRLVTEPKPWGTIR